MLRGTATLNTGKAFSTNTVENTATVVMVEPAPGTYRTVTLFIYRRPTLYPLEIAVDFLKSL
jgi:hypothetical protein